MSLPAAPTNVTVVPGVAQATVSWTASTSPDVTGYKVFCVPDNKLPNLAAAGATSLVVTKLKNGTPCTFRVHAVNAAGMSAASVPVVPAPVPAAPKVVAAVTPTVGSVLVTLTGKAQKGSSILNYTLTVSPAAPNAVIPTNIAATAGSFGATATITGLTVGVSYVVSATATSPTGTSAAGAAKAVTIVDVPNAPVLLTALTGLRNAVLNWETPANNGLPLLGYNVSYSVGSATPTVIQTKVVNNLVINGLVTGSQYTFRVQAKNAKGLSVSSNTITGTPN